MTVHFLRSQLDAELVITRDVLEAARHAPLDWKPHPSSFSLGRLAMHVATIPGWLPAFTRSAAYDMGAGGPGPDVPASSDEILAQARGGRRTGARHAGCARRRGTHR